METKTRNDILLEERVAKIDDINFDKIYDSKELATKEYNNFDKEIVIDNNLLNIPKVKEQDNSSVFSLEIQPNEFFDNIDLGHEEVETRKAKAISYKPLFFTFTSIAVLLCILFIYNLFVIGNLQVSVSKSNPASINSYVNSENNYIIFENDAKLGINDNVESVDKEDLQTNWFDSMCDNLNNLFGGEY